jgi:hypothetical protein
MSAKLAVLAVLVAAVTLTSVAAAGPQAAKQRVAITVTILPSGKGLLTPLNDGALERDSGTFGGDWSPVPDRTVAREGQTVDIHSGLWTFAGKRGNLVFRERTEWVDLGHDGNRDGLEDGIAIGTWKVVRGTGPYAGITGGGRSGHLGQGRKWVARYEGFLAAP